MSKLELARLVQSLIEAQGSLDGLFQSCDIAPDKYHRSRTRYAREAIKKYFDNYPWPLLDGDNNLAKELK